MITLQSLLNAARALIELSRPEEALQLAQHVIDVFKSDTESLIFDSAVHISVFIFEKLQRSDASTQNIVTITTLLDSSSLKL